MLDTERGPKGSQAMCSFRLLVASHDKSAHEQRSCSHGARMRIYQPLAARSVTLCHLSPTATLAYPRTRIP